MIRWWVFIVAVWASAGLGFFVAALLAACRDECDVVEQCYLLVEAWAAGPLDTELFAARFNYLTELLRKHDADRFSASFVSGMKMSQEYTDWMVRRGTGKERVNEDDDRP